MKLYKYNVYNNELFQIAEKLEYITEGTMQDIGKARWRSRIWCRHKTCFPLLSPPCPPAGKDSGGE